jgi:hypothetical protein
MTVTARLFALFGWLALSVLAQMHAAADLGKQVTGAGLDPTECYRVHDIEISKEDARFYLTDGYLMFGKPVNRGPVTAVFSADTDGGDAEVLLLPPDRSERKSMAGYAGAPNLNEHFTQAAFIFTDDTAQSILEQIKAGGAKKYPDIGALLETRWGQIVANLMSGFESRIVLDLVTLGASKGGFFEAVIQGRKLGNFDVTYDARAYEQLVAGQITNRNGTTWWDTWTSFQSRSHRGLPPPLPEEQILSYRIDVTLDASLTMHCVTRMRIRSTADSRTALAFDLTGQMRATSAKVDGAPAEVYERDSVRNGLVQNNGNELLMVLPATPLEPGSEHEIEISHEGRVVLEAGHNVYFVSARGTWYPGRGLQFATYDVIYRYPANLDLVAAGQVKEDRVEGDTRITHRVPDGPVRLLGFNLGEYERRLTERDGLTVEVCANKQMEDALRPLAQQPPAPLSAPDGTRPVRRPRSIQIPEAMQAEVQPQRILNPSDQLTRIAGEVENAMAFYRARFGEPPLKHIEVSPLPGRFGQGFAGMIYLPTVNYLAPDVAISDHLSPADRAFFQDLLVAHEIAHQWWGNTVTSVSYHHEWLMEALSSYSAVMYMETRVGPKADELALDSFRKSLFVKGPDGETAESEGPVVQGRRLEGSNNPNASAAVIYGKGTWIMHMLRRRMGDEQWLKMLAEMRRRYQWKPIDTEAFRLLCAEFLPPGSPDAKLENFFDLWVYGTGVPTLKLTYTVKGKPGAYKLTGTVTQTDVPDDYSIAVPIEIQTGRGKPVVQQVRTGSDPVEFSVNVTAANARAVLDPGWSVLRR